MKRNTKGTTKGATLAAVPVLEPQPGESARTRRDPLAAALEAEVRAVFGDEAAERIGRPGRSSWQVDVEYAADLDRDRYGSSVVRLTDLEEQLARVKMDLEAARPESDRSCVLPRTPEAYALERLVSALLALVGRGAADCGHGGLQPREW